MATRSLKAAKAVQPIDWVLTAEPDGSCLRGPQEEIETTIAAADRAWEVRLDRVEARILDLIRECERVKAERDALALTLALRSMQGGPPS
jgi:hypothetical protein